MDAPQYFVHPPAMELSMVGFFMMFCSIFLGGLALAGQLPKIKLRPGVSVGLMFMASFFWLSAYLWCFERPPYVRVQASFKGFLTPQGLVSAQEKSSEQSLPFGIFNTSSGEMAVVVLPESLQKNAPETLFLFKKVPDERPSSV